MRFVRPVRSFGFMHDHSFLYIFVNNQSLDIRSQVNWTLSLVTVDGFLRGLCGYAWVNMLTYHNGKNGV